MRTLSSLCNPLPDKSSSFCGSNSINIYKCNRATKVVNLRACYSVITYPLVCRLVIYNFDPENYTKNWKNLRNCCQTAKKKVLWNTYSWAALVNWAVKYVEKFFFVILNNLLLVLSTRKKTS